MGALREAHVSMDLSRGEVGSSGLLKGSGFSVEAQVTKQWRCNSAVGKGKELLPASVSVCSRVAFTDESLVAEANRFSGSSSLSPLGSLDSECRLLKMLLQDVNLLEFSGSAANGTSGKELVVMTEELEPGCNSVGEDLVSLPSKLLNFSNYLEMPVAGCEKEISSLLRKLESKKGHGVKVSGGKRILPSSSHFEREIRMLECSVNYKSSPLTSRGRERSTGESPLTL